ncbi:RNA-directed DNA polymerase, eukaryota, reverse transcriptase zinc-binding domain protein [Tanacetum coccineum]
MLINLYKYWGSKTCRKSKIPKIQTPAKLSNYRPIACCNVINKCISKVITERIKKFLGKLVSQNQSAFINRQIHDNILISQELLKGYGRKSGPKRVALKIDLQKAYDTVNWSFMEDILKGFGFPERMVNWIMVCVTSTSFSLAVNGKSCGFFRGGRGLRQGDPMSPYLFTLVMEILNLLMIRKIKSNGLFQYHFGCKHLKITHVCFADDLLMFCDEDPDSVKTIKEVIDEFGSVSRLLPNYNNSTIIFGSMNAEDRQMYWATVFLLPQSVIEDINRLLKGFLWNQSDKSNGKAKVAWKNLCMPKSKSGICLKNLSVWNKAMISKHLWYVAADKDTLRVKWINTVKLKGRSIWEISEEVSDSWGWRNILKIRHKVRRHFFMKVGNGAKTPVWFDYWSNLGVLSEVISYRDLYDARMETNLTLKDFWKNHKGQWPVEWSSLFPMITQIYNITLIPDKRDDLWWKSNDGNIPKHEFIPWLAIKGNPTTQDKIRKWGTYDMLACPLCINDIDLHNNLFFSCDYADRFWHLVKRQIDVKSNGSNWEAIVNEFATMKNGNTIKSVIRRLCLAASIYLLWQERNNILFKYVKRRVDELFKSIFETVKIRLSSLKVKRSTEVHKIEVNWNIKLNSPTA